MFFKEIEGETVLLVEGGVYREAKLYTRAGNLYAKFGTGFVRLARDGSTSKTSGSLNWIVGTMSINPDADKMGRLVYKG